MKSLQETCSSLKRRLITYREVWMEYLGSLHPPWNHHKDQRLLLLLYLVWNQITADLFLYKLPELAQE